MKVLLCLTLQFTLHRNAVDWLNREYFWIFWQKISNQVGAVLCKAHTNFIMVDFLKGLVFYQPIVTNIFGRKHESFIMFKFAIHSLQNCSWWIKQRKLLNILTEDKKQVWAVQSSEKFHYVSFDERFYQPIETNILFLFTNMQAEI